ncbi:hypothetical protein WJX73_000087 [Symbiochloris irregularis]|uniref:Uncharacterized protein n=1 Tax=Symbiochloris irregularis TaxID=706552 RepID=A0AAW1NXD8_9CHLO
MVQFKAAALALLLVLLARSAAPADASIGPQRRLLTGKQLKIVRAAFDNGWNVTSLAAAIEQAKSLTEGDAFAEAAENEFNKEQLNLTSNSSFAQKYGMALSQAALTDVNAAGQAIGRSALHGKNASEAAAVAMAYTLTTGQDVVYGPVLAAFTTAMASYGCPDMHNTLWSAKEASEHADQFTAFKAALDNAPSLHECIAGHTQAEYDKATSDAKAQAPTFGGSTQLSNETAVRLLKKPSPSAYTSINPIRDKLQDSACSCTSRTNKCSFPTSWSELSISGARNTVGNSGSARHSSWRCHRAAGIPSSVLGWDHDQAAAKSTATTSQKHKCSIFSPALRAKLIRRGARNTVRDSSGPRHSPRRHHRTASIPSGAPAPPFPSFGRAYGGSSMASSSQSSPRAYSYPPPGPRTGFGSPFFGLEFAAKVLASNLTNTTAPALITVLYQTAEEGGGATLARIAGVAYNASKSAVDSSSLFAHAYAAALTRLANQNLNPAADALSYAGTVGGDAGIAAGLAIGNALSSGNAFTAGLITNTASVVIARQGCSAIVPLLTTAERAVTAADISPGSKAIFAQYLDTDPTFQPCLEIPEIVFPAFAPAPGPIQTDAEAILPSIAPDSALQIAANNPPLLPILPFQPPLVPQTAVSPEQYSQAAPAPAPEQSSVPPTPIANSAQVFLAEPAVIASPLVGRPLNTLETVTGAGPGTLG